MKNIYVLFVFIFITSVTYSQNTKLPKTEKKGKLTEVTIYYDSGEIMQHGFYSKTGKLHGGWESYFEDGSRKCIAFYDYGVKVGTWTYWNNGEETKVVYDKNKVISVEKVNPETKTPKNTIDH